MRRRHAYFRRRERTTGPWEACNGQTTVRQARALAPRFHGIFLQTHRGYRGWGCARLTGPPFRLAKAIAYGTRLARQESLHVNTAPNPPLQSVKYDSRRSHRRNVCWHHSLSPPFTDVVEAPGLWARPLFIQNPVVTLPTVWYLSGARSRT